MVPEAHAQQTGIRGVVRDRTGASVAHASVTLHVGQSTRTMQTDDSGRFSFPDLPHADATVSVSAANFKTTQVSVNPDSISRELEIVLRPADVSERLIVSATRSDLSLSQSPGSTFVFSEVDLAANPTLTIDDVLRQVPGFSLFRRTTSRVANPTAQGVSLVAWAQVAPVER